MHRKMLVAFLLVFGLALSAQARYIRDGAYSASDEDDGILPLPFDNFENKEIEDDNSIPVLGGRIGVPVDYDTDKERTNGVVLRNKFGGDEDEENNVMEEKKPGWVRRQWRRLGSLSGALTNSREISSAKVAEFTEKVCNLLRFVTSKAAKVCQVVPLKFCSPFYGSSDEDSIAMPEANGLDI